MKLPIVLLIISVTSGLVHNAPVETKKSIPVSLEAIDVDETELEGLKSSPKVKKTSKELETPNEVNDAENGRVVQESTNSESEETSIPCPHENINTHVTSPVNMMNQNIELIPSIWYDKRPQTFYQVDYLKNSDRSGVVLSDYEGIPYPLVHANMFAAPSPVSAVSYLPPVYSPRFYDPVLSRYFSELSTHNMVKPKHVRSVPSREEDFMAELEHAAMMNNIIPTMPVPFVRHAGYPTPQLYQAPVTAVFPQMVSESSIPILISCSPKIVRGTFETPYSGKHELALPYNV